MDMKIRTFFDNMLVSSADINSLCIKNTSVDKIVNSIVKDNNSQASYKHIKKQEL